MLGKLIKYDILADWKKYAIVYAATLLLSIMTFILEKCMSNVQNNTFLVIIDKLVSAAFMVMVVATALIVFVFSVMRFYKNLVRDEGYLMHTLPVPTWQLIASKLITVYIWFIAAVIVIIASTGIILGEPLWFFKMIDGWSELMADLTEMAGEEGVQPFTTFMGYVLLSTVLSPFYFMTHTYFSLALGNLSNSHKLGIAVLAFFGIYIGEQIISAVILSVNTAGLITAEEVSDAQGFTFLNNSMLAAIILSTVLAVGMLIGAERIFAKKLNLE